MTKKKHKPIYTVFVCFVDKDGNSKRHTLWLWVPTFKAAEKIITANDFCWEAGYYNFGVIEEIYPGEITTKQMQWYKPVYKGETYPCPMYVKKIRQPSWAKNRTGFVI